MCGGCDRMEEAQELRSWQVCRIFHLISELAQGFQNAHADGTSGAGSAAAGRRGSSTLGMAITSHTRHPRNPRRGCRYVSPSRWGGEFRGGTWPSFRLTDVFPQNTKEPMRLFMISVLDDMPKEIQPPDDLLQLRKRVLVEDDFSE